VVRAARQRGSVHSLTGQQDSMGRARDGAWLKLQVLCPAGLAEWLVAIGSCRSPISFSIALKKIEHQFGAINLLAH